jgi:putative intracellular protease/amidase
MRILIVMTSNDRLGASGRKTGLWLEEFAAPYYLFRDTGAELVLASPLGGRPPVDPKSDEPDAQTAATRRFAGDRDAQQAFAATRRLPTLSAEEFDALFYPGGHGPLWDLHQDKDSLRLIGEFTAAGKPVAAVCHGPCVLIHARAADGSPLLQGKRVTAFTNSEEQAVGLTRVVPYALEDALKKQGAQFECGADFQPFCVRDGLLITGQNPASSEPAARALIALLEGEK